MILELVMSDPEEPALRISTLLPIARRTQPNSHEDILDQL
jgi:hypothetical protein